MIANTAEKPRNWCSVVDEVARTTQKCNWCESIIPDELTYCPVCKRDEYLMEETPSGREKYLIKIYGDVEAGAPELCLSDEDRQRKANEYLEKHGPWNGVYALDIDWKKRTFEIFSLAGVDE